jgi:hypothetical protein
LGAPQAAHAGIGAVVIISSIGGFNLLGLTKDDLDKLVKHEVLLLPDIRLVLVFAESDAMLCDAACLAVQMMDASANGSKELS